MSTAAKARISVYVGLWLLVGAWLLAAREPARIRESQWQEPLERASAALSEGDARQARQHWEQAYREAVGARSAAALLAVGHAHLNIGEASRGGHSAVPEARRIFLAALFAARERQDAHGVAMAGQAFAALGDREVANRAFDVAIALASRSRDAGARAHRSRGRPVYGRFKPLSISATALVVERLNTSGRRPAPARRPHRRWCPSPATPTAGPE
jgi:tetratricopeptide (TPR) repeat protein